MNKLFLTLLITTATNLVSGYKETFGHPVDIRINENGTVVSGAGLVRHKIEESFFTAFNTADNNMRMIHNFITSNPNHPTSSELLKENPPFFFKDIIDLFALFFQYNSVGSLDTLLYWECKINEAYYELAVASLDPEDDLYNFELINNFFEKDVFQRLYLPENIIDLLKLSYKWATWLIDPRPLNKILATAPRIGDNISRFDIETICEYTELLKNINVQTKNLV